MPSGMLSAPLMAPTSTSSSGSLSIRKDFDTQENETTNPKSFALGTYITDWIRGLTITSRYGPSTHKLDDIKIRYRYLPNNSLNHLLQMNFQIRMLQLWWHLIMRNFATCQLLLNCQLNYGPESNKQFTNGKIISSNYKLLSFKRTVSRNGFGF